MLQALHAKQGRKTQFASVAERDSYLQNEIKQLKDSLATVQGARQQVEQQAADLASEANDLASVSSNAGCIHWRDMSAVLIPGSPDTGVIGTSHAVIVQGEITMQI